jgi:hypothetical protein
MNQEIHKFGRFAFRDKRSNGEASKKFVEGFTRSAPQFGRTGEMEMNGMKQKEREGVRENVFEKFSSEAQLHDAGPSKPNYPYGTCIDDLYAHSWLNSAGSWLWVPKGTALVAAENKLWFPRGRVRSSVLGGVRERSSWWCRGRWTGAPLRRWSRWIEGGMLELTGGEA